MDVTAVHRDGFTEIALRGELNQGGAPAVSAAVSDALAEGSRLIVLDLAGTVLIDSAGLGALVACLAVARGRGAALRLANACEQVRSALELAGMAQDLPPFDSVQAAAGAPRTA